MNPYVAIVSSLLFLPALYFLLHRPKQNTKPHENEAETEQPRAGWRQQYEDWKLFLPLLLPKDSAVRRRLVYRYLMMFICVGARRVLRVAHPILLRRIVQVLSSETVSPRLPWIEIALFIFLHKVVQGVINNVQEAFRARAEGVLVKNISVILYTRLLELSADYHENKKSGSVWRAVHRSGSQTVAYFGDIFFTEVAMVFDVILSIGTCWTIFDGGLALAMSAAFACYVGFSLALRQHTRRNFDIVIKENEREANLSYDVIQNWPTVSHFNRVEYEGNRYTSAIKRSREAYDQLFLNHQIWRSIGRDLVASVGMAAVCILGGYQIRTSQRSTGDFIMLFQFLTDTFPQLVSLSRIFESTDRFLSNSHNVIELLKLQPTVKDKEGAPDLKVGNGTVEFDNVSFSYNGKTDVVKSVSFKAEGGRTVAIVGETGGGKSTLLKLLSRTYDVKSGAIRIDGQDLRDVRQDSLREQMSIVPQLIGVFNASILENLRYANLEATREQIEQACEAAALHKRIMSFPDGYDQVVGERGVKLSGGERQRLAIARALLRPGRIVLLDEATSDLDAETEARIQDYLKKWYVGRTVIVVAHRLATIANADLIIPFKDGQVVEVGRHGELLQKKGYFYMLWNKQRLAWNPASKIEAESEV
ncbi:hypothetical protein MFIFM68171_07554 [Madurella fahalii]|uniref:Uncharacterized protein n=1 Tax=Madurella fahalii TaxID=1157608 RepID=A0ABQ0GHW7_9PEZI